MHITWHGQYTIKIVSDSTTLVIDPYAPNCGLNPFRAKADVVALSSPGDSSMSHLAGIQGEYQLINTPGEYSIKGMMLHALGWTDQDKAEHSLHLWEIEKITLLHLGALNRDLTDAELQVLERKDIDILFLPIGGHDGLTPAKAIHLLTTIEPRITIPVHFALPGLKEKLDNVNSFASEMGINAKNKQPKLIVKANKLPLDTTTVILTP